MAFEKAKVLKAAEKFLSQGKINAAIKEYRQVVDHDDGDLTTLNMLGDLYVRAGKKDEAVHCFERIAEHYRTQEFNLKAIAMYKKIERLRARDPEIAYKLAELYASQGLVVDARAQYLIVADAHTRTGDNRKALEILHRIADLDPNNTEIRLKLAEGYLKENMRSEAGAAFVQAASRLYYTHAHERALEAYNKALKLLPGDLEVLNGVLTAHVALGTADEAAEVLERAVDAQPEDNRLINMLASAYLEAEDPAGAERAIGMLMAQDTSHYNQYLPVARLFLKTGQIDDTVRLLTGIIERMLAGREERDLLQLVNDVLERDPDHVAALRMMVRINWWQRDMDSLRSSLERLAEAAEASDLVDEERYALTQLVRLAPDEPKYLERLNQLGGLQDDSSEDFSVAEPPAAVPEFETFAVVNDDHEVQGTEIEEEPAEFETHAAVSDPTASFADLNESFETEPTSEPPPADFQEVDFGSVVTEPSTQAATDDTGEPRHENMMRQELESVDFYIAQGYNDIAFDTLDMLERQFGQHAEITARRKRLKGEDVEEAVPAAFDFGGTDVGATEPATLSVEADMAFASLADAPVVTEAPGLDAGLAELFEEFKEAEEQDTVTEDFETRYNMGTAYKEMDLIDDAVQEFQIAVTLVKPSDGTSRFLQCCNMLGHCFMHQNLPEAAALWFKKGLAAPGHTEDEYQALRYELANAYEQVGDFEQAKQLYTEVYGIDVSYREVADRLRDLSNRKKED